MTLPDELLAGTDTAKTESKTGQAKMPPPREFEHPTPVGQRYSRLRVEIPTLSLLNSCGNR